MLQQGILNIKVEVNNKVYEIIENENNEFVECKKIIETTALGHRFFVQLIAKTAIKIIDVSYRVNYKGLNHHRLFFNGYQSWTDSQELKVNDKMPSLSKWVKPLVKKYQFDKYGDNMVRAFKNKKGQFHGFTYSYIKDNDQLQLIGSLDERSGFTIIEYNHRKNEWTISKDNRGLMVDKPTTMIDVVFLKGTEDIVFNEYFAQMGLPLNIRKATTGWTSWYNHYQNITEDIILHNLTCFVESSNTMDVFQIDDGYQQAIGDWLLVDQIKFPSGMKHIANQIHEHQLKAGIWVAPFVCEKQSQLFKDHPDWIRKDDFGQYLMAGSNWSGFYALDLEKKEVKEYIKNVFDVLLNEWGYDMVKLDFLYAACLLPTKTKTRGQLMGEAMDFLRECVKDKLILGCGVPLASAFGKVDFCRIGCDVGLDWNDKLFMRWMHRERISTYHSINNAIGRSHLNQRAFINDPDVYILRDQSVRLSLTQRNTLAIVNKLFGSLLFTSDDLCEYNSKQASLHKWITNKDQISILSKKTIDKGVYDIIAMIASTKVNVLINTTSKPVTFLKQNKKLTPFECVSIEVL